MVHLGENYVSHMRKTLRFENNSKISSLYPSLYGFCFKLHPNFSFDAFLYTIKMKCNEKKIQL